MIKTQISWWRAKNCQESIWKHMKVLYSILYSELVPLTPRHFIETRRKYNWTKIVNGTHSRTHPCGFRKGFSTQQCPLTLLGKCKNAISKAKIFGALLTNLSHLFECHNHALFLAKLNAHNFTLHTLKLIHNYLSKRQQRLRVNDSYSLW